MKKELYFATTGILALLTATCVNFAFGTTSLESWINANAKKQQFEKTSNLFSITTETAEEHTSSYNNFLKLNRETLHTLNRSALPNISIELPTGKDKNMTLELSKVELYSPEFELGEINNGSRIVIPFQKGVFYRGIVVGEPGSLVALTVFENELNGWICTNESSLELAPETKGSANYVLTDAKTRISHPAFTCDAIYPPGQQKTSEPNQSQGVGCKVVTIYFECDNKLYKDFNSSSSAVMNYVSSVFNQVATLYRNENIDVLLSGVNVWSTPDPYAGYTSITEMLGAYKNTRGTNFNGILSHLLTTRQLGGGISYTDVLCNKSYAHGVSCIYPYYGTAPTYSWTVEVLAHEIGHNMGSNHTHWCGWSREDGTTGPLDNCFTPEGSCTPGPSPSNGGTIMSYCHLTGGGINFTNGFGPVPGDFIRNRIMNSTCISAGGLFPTGLSTASITATSARLNWMSVGNVSTYTVEYRELGSTTWNTADGTLNTFIQLTQLKNGTAYTCRVKTECSPFSNPITFSTLKNDPCNTPASLTANATSGTSAILDWTSVAGATRYTVQLKPSGGTSWTTLESTALNTYTVNGLNGTTSYSYRVKADCSSYSTPVNFTTTSTGCPAPTNLVVSSITAGSARFSWNPAEGATQYTISYKPITESRWTSSTTNMNTLTVNNLTSGMTYEWRVKSNCSSSSAAVNFQTVASLPAPVGTNLTETIQLSPNPATTKIILQVNPNDEFGTPAYVSISNMIGKSQFQERFESAMIELDISTLPDGIYIAQVIDTKGRVTNKRFLKK